MTDKYLTSSIADAPTKGLETDLLELEAISIPTNHLILTPMRSIACPRSTGELAKGATWERLDQINATLPNPLSLMFIMEA